MPPSLDASSCGCVHVYLYLFVSVTRGIHRFPLRPGCSGHEIRPRAKYLKREQIPIPRISSPRNRRNTLDHAFSAHGKCRKARHERVGKGAESSLFCVLVFAAGGSGSERWRNGIFCGRHLVFRGSSKSWQVCTGTNQTAILQK
ncbi:unnamed protein product [Hapterophycus canaliculatus]